MNTKERNIIMRAGNRRPLTEMTVGTSEHEEYYNKKLHDSQFAINFILGAGSVVVISMVVYGIYRMIAGLMWAEYTNYSIDVVIVFYQ